MTAVNSFVSQTSHQTWPHLAINHAKRALVTQAKEAIILMSSRKLQTLPSDVGTPAELLDLTGNSAIQPRPLTFRT